MRVPVLLIPMLFIGFADAQSPALVGYWQNWNDASAPYLELDQIDPRYNVIGIAFAEPAAGTTYDMVFTPSGTPQGTFIAQVAGGIWGAYLPLIHALRDRIDILQVQLYNSGSMYGIDGGIYAQGTADFIVSQVEAVIQGFATSGGNFIGLEPQHVAVGLPANSAAGGGTRTRPSCARRWSTCSAPDHNRARTRLRNPAAIRCCAA
ncbi:MAG: hypothetical protein IPI81_01605 [Flavobacteriales bacterium]|nr:hypothetical protein [Flavobacteriales bacterium]